MTGERVAAEVGRIIRESATGALEWSEDRRRRLLFFGSGVLVLVQSNLRSESPERVAERVPGLAPPALAEEVARTRLRELLRASGGTAQFHADVPSPGFEPLDVHALLWAAADALPAIPPDARPRSVPLYAPHLPRIPCGAEIARYLLELDGSRELEDVLEFGPAAPDEVARALRVALTIGAVAVGTGAQVAPRTAPAARMVSPFQASVAASVAPPARAGPAEPVTTHDIAGFIHSALRDLPTDEAPRGLGADTFAAAGPARATIPRADAVAAGAPGPEDPFLASAARSAGPRASRGVAAEPDPFAAPSASEGGAARPADPFAAPSSSAPPEEDTNDFRSFAGPFGGASATVAFGPASGRAPAGPATAAPAGPTPTDPDTVGAAPGLASGPAPPPPPTPAEPASVERAAASGTAELAAVFGPALVNIRGATDHFGVLGTGWRDAVETHRRAYLALAGRLHPDRLADQPAEVRAVAEELFERVRAAWETLGDDAAREAYIARVIRGEKSEAERATEKMRRILEAENEFRRGVAELNAGRITAANTLFALAAAGAPEEVEFGAYAAYTRFRLAHGRDLAATDEAARGLAGALQANENLDNVWVLQGIVHRLLGNDAAARDALVRALKLKPSNPDAVRELRRLEREREVSAAKTAAGGGILGKLFGKK